MQAKPPEHRWLILKGAIGGTLYNDSLDIQELPWAFKPLAFGVESDKRCLGGLWIGDEARQNRLGDLDAMFGTMGNLVMIPEEAQHIYPAKREFRLGIRNLSQDTAYITLAILGLVYYDMGQPPAIQGGEFKWLNLFGTLGAGTQAHLADSLSFPFKPYAYGYVSTGRAEATLEVDNAPFMGQAADLAALFGTLGNLVAVPPEGRRIYQGKQTFDAIVTDLSGQDNDVTVSIFGTQYRS